MKLKIPTFSRKASIGKCLIKICLSSNERNTRHDLIQGKLHFMATDRHTEMRDKGNQKRVPLVILQADLRVG